MRVYDVANKMDTLGVTAGRPAAADVPRAVVDRIVSRKRRVAMKILKYVIKKLCNTQRCFADL